MLARRGKITGSRLKDVLPKRDGSMKIGYYELIAERLGIPSDGEDAMARGHRLECEAIAEFEKVTGLKVDTSLTIWSRDDNESIAVSPDGVIDEKTAVEVKCLSSARHIEAVLTNEIPDEYEEQVVQYFAVNDQLETLYFIFYDPRLLAKPFHMVTVTRDVVMQARVTQVTEKQVQMLAEVERIVNELTDF